VFAIWTICTLVYVWLGLPKNSPGTVKTFAVASAIASSNFAAAASRSCAAVENYSVKRSVL